MKTVSRNTRNIALLIAALAANSGSISATETLTYESDVRPILKAHCFHCHGEAGEKEGELDVRLRRYLVAGGDSGEAIVPGAATESLLYQRVASGEMPPEDKRLAAHDVDVIRRWIDQGAPTATAEPDNLDEQPYFTDLERNFWLFQPIERPSLPQIDSPLARTPIDYFVLEKLRAGDLQFSKRADRLVLMRRVYFDLLGLPPTPAEVESFAADTSPDAYERLVDRLLASPRYGERWGRHWLDVAGYADSEGYVDSDPVRPWAYRYRDYVIQSLNAGKPYDQFLVEQLAGDELVPQPHQELSPRQVELLTATGFLRMAPDGTGAGGIDHQVARNEVIAGTIEVASTAVLGLTVACARCHDHRYDPISQRDYYQLRALFEPALDWKSWRNPTQRRVSLYRTEDRKVANTIEAKAKQAVAERQAILDQHLARTLEEELIKAPDELKDALRTAYQTPKAKRSTEQTSLLKEYPNIQNISAGSLYLYSQQRARRANEIVAVADAKAKQLVEQVTQQRLATLEPAVQTAVNEALATEADKRTDEQRQLIAAHPGIDASAATLKEFDAKGAELVAGYRAAAKRCRELDSKKQLADLQAAIDAIRATIPLEHFVRALTEPENHTPPTHLFRRGSHQSPAEIVKPAELEILRDAAPVELPYNAAEVETSGRRLAYARHLTSGRHPITARVIANRVWFHHFGRGLVNTPGDFGFLGDRPSHPQLLDWMADELMRNGWRLKPLHRLIVLSHTYQQLSERTNRLNEVDPDNRLYARQSIRRVQSEVFRDAVLTVSGRYDNRMFGSPIPVMEDGVGQIVIGVEKLDGERKPQSQAGYQGQEHRRSIYVQVRRSRPLAVLETFDIATVSPNCARRASSNVAPQSLLLINSQFMVTYAQALADRVLRFSEEPEEQLRYAWELTYAESPNAETVRGLLEFVAQQTELIRKQNTKLTVAVSRREALAVACHALLSSNQFLYVD